MTAQCFWDEGCHDLDFELDLKISRDNLLITSNLSRKFQDTGLMHSLNTNQTFCAEGHCGLDFGIVDLTTIKDHIQVMSTVSAKLKHTMPKRSLDINRKRFLH